MTNLDYYTAGLLDGTVRVSFEADRTVLYVSGLAAEYLQKTWGGTLRGPTLRIGRRKDVEGLLTKWSGLPTRRLDEIQGALDRIAQQRRAKHKYELSI